MEPPSSSPSPTQKPPVTAFVAFESLPAPLAFRRPAKTLAAYSPDCVVETLREAQKLAESGFHVFGSVAYEAAPAFDPKLRVGTPVADFPLALFHAYRPEDAEAGPFPLDAGRESEFQVGSFEASVDFPRYEAAIEAIRERIRQGDTYQVNHTLRLRAPFSGHPPALLASRANGRAEDRGGFGGRKCW